MRMTLFFFCYAIMIARIIIIEILREVYMKRDAKSIKSMYAICCAKIKLTSDCVDDDDDDRALFGVPSCLNFHPLSMLIQ